MNLRVWDLVSLMKTGSFQYETQEIGADLTVFSYTGADLGLSLGGRFFKKKLKFCRPFFCFRSTKLNFRAVPELYKHLIRTNNFAPQTNFEKLLLNFLTIEAHCY